MRKTRICTRCESAFFRGKIGFMAKTARNLGELKLVAEGFLKKLSKGAAADKAVLVGLSGDLGSGKTAFTKCVATILGVDDTVTSPTFVLEKRYNIPVRGGRQRFARLIHIDAYRLNKGEEMNALDWEATLGDKQNLIFLEWPEQVSSALPKNMINLNFEYVDDGVRSISGDYIE